MSLAFLREAGVGLKAEVQAKGLGVLPRTLGKLAAEVAGLFGLIPHGARSARVVSQLVRLDTYIKEQQASAAAKAPAAASTSTTPYGVLLHTNQPYGPMPRHVLDIYVPEPIARAMGNQEDLASGGRPRALAPVLFFCHGGVWASGETWHYSLMATRLAQAGVVVVCTTYTLYPDALVPQMREEVSAALGWVMDHIASFGGDPTNITAAGHSAGAHLVALALLQRAGLPCGPAADLSSLSLHAPFGVVGGAPGRLPSPAPGASAASSSSSSLSTTSALDGGARAPRDARQPRRFVGLAGVYDIGKHWRHEEARGVEALSMMTRAMGGFEHFAALSPTCLLKHLAAQLEGDRHHAANAAAQQEGPGSLLSTATPLAWDGPASDEASSSNGNGDGGGAQNGAPARAPGPGPSFFRSFSLLGDAVPQRLAPGGLPAAGGGGGGGWGRRSPRGGNGAPGGGLQEALAQLPPSFLQAGCIDHVVPFHESTELAAALSRCGVPTRLLLYTHTTHACFVLKWAPRSSSAEAAPPPPPPPPRDASASPPDPAGLVVQQQATAAPFSEQRGALLDHHHHHHHHQHHQHHDAPDLDGMSDFARDLLRIVQGAADAGQPLCSPSATLPARQRAHASEQAQHGPAVLSRL